MSINELKLILCYNVVALVKVKLVDDDYAVVSERDVAAVDDFGTNAMGDDGPDLQRLLVSVFAC